MIIQSRGREERERESERRAFEMHFLFFEILIF